MIETALYFQAALWLVVAVIFWRSRFGTIFHPATYYLLVHFLVFVARPFFVHYANFDIAWRFMGFEPSEAQFVRALEISSLGLVVFVLTCYLGSIKAKKLEFLGPVVRFTQSEKTAFYIVMVILLPMTVYSIYTMMTQVTEDGLPVGDWVNGTYVMTNVSGYVFEFQSVLLPILVIFLLRWRFNVLALVPVVAYYGYRSTVGWARWTIVLSGVAFLLVFCWSRRRRQIPVYIVALLPVMFVFFSYVGQNRQAMRQVLTGQTLDRTVLDKSTEWRDKYDTLDFANFDFLTYIAAVVPEKTETYNYGIDWLQIFTEPVPRSLWKGKPVGAPSFFNLNDYGNFAGLTYSLPGGGWMDGGWLGVIIVCGLWGVGLGKFYSWFTRNTNSTTASLVYIIGISMIVQLYRDGNFSIFRFWFFTITPVLLWSSFAKLIEPRTKKRNSRSKLPALEPAGSPVEP